MMLVFTDANCIIELFQRMMFLSIQSEIIKNPLDFSIIEQKKEENIPKINQNQKKKRKSIFIHREHFFTDCLIVWLSFDCSNHCILYCVEKKNIKKIYVL